MTNCLAGRWPANVTYIRMTDICMTEFAAPYTGATAPSGGSPGTAGLT
jgi:hypothetical protein